MVADLLSRESLAILAAFALGSLAWWLVTWPRRHAERRALEAARVLVTYMLQRRTRGDRLDSDADLWRRVRVLDALASEAGAELPPAPPRHASGAVRYWGKP